MKSNMVNFTHVKCHVIPFHAQLYGSAECGLLMDVLFSSFSPLASVSK